MIAVALSPCLGPYVTCTAHAVALRFIVNYRFFLDPHLLCFYRQWDKANSTYIQTGWLPNRTRDEVVYRISAQRIQSRCEGHVRTHVR